MTSAGKIAYRAFAAVVVIAVAGIVVYYAAYAPEETAASRTSLATLCDAGRRTAIPDAPPYDGPAPHPVLTFGDRAPTFPNDPVWTPAPEVVQVVACFDGLTVKDAGATMCHYNFPEAVELRLRPTVDHVTLYEVRSRRQIAELDISTTKCPWDASGTDEQTVPAVPSADDVRAALRKYVEE